MRVGRRRAALLASAVLVTTLPWTASAFAPPLTCGPKQTGRWEQIPVKAFQPISGMTTENRLSAYSLDKVKPQEVAATNGARILLSHAHGCDWENSYAMDPGASQTQPFVGTVSAFVSLGVLQGTVLAAVQEGGGTGSRPHMMRLRDGAWTTSDTGLPAAGAPRLLRTASDGRTAYLTISPNGTGGSDTGNGGPLPPLPAIPGLPGGGTTTPTGLLYATADAGVTWSLRTNATQLPGGGTGFSTLEVDPFNANTLYGIVDGSVLVSRDGGSTFEVVTEGPATAVTAGFFGMAVVFDGAGHGFLYAGTQLVRAFPAPKGVTSAAARFGDSGVVVESSGVLNRVEPFLSTIAAVPAPSAPRKGTLSGDHGSQASFHAVAGNTLLRYVDPVPKHVDVPDAAVGDRSVAPPRPGVVTPATREITLRAGETATEEFLLSLPKNPTPLDLFFMVDVSTSMTTYIENLKGNIQRLVDRLTDAKVDLKVGVAEMGTGPAEGEDPYPEFYAYPPTIGPDGQPRPGPPYRKPRIYNLLRPIGDTGPTLRQAIDSIRLETDPPVGANHQGTYHEGQLLALEQAVTGSGIKTEQDVEAGLPSYSAVAPGQDAQWRGNPDVRRIVVIASDETFDAPYGTPEKPESTPENRVLDYSRTLKILNDARVGVFGITAGSPDSVADMQVMAAGTNTLSPNGGVSCGGEPEQRLEEGRPLVCSQEGDFSAIIGQVLEQLSDKQDAVLRAHNATPVLTALGGAKLRGLNVKQASSARFTATVSCVGVDAGRYVQGLDVLLRGYLVGSAALVVNCVRPSALVPPGPLRPGPVAPAPQPPLAPPAPPPAAQPQPQPNPNINPLTAAVIQEQQELQLALAMNQLLQDEEQQEQEQLAMVDRRVRQEVQAFGVLLFAMTACAGLGLARLRTRSVAVGVRTAR